jgi:hypothetical protein
MKHQSQRTNMDVVPEESRDSLDTSSKDEQNPLPLRAVLTRAVAISVLNYATLALLEVVALSLIPLIWSTSVEFGGLNFSPASIGLCISVYGFMSGIFQFIFFPRLVGRFGPRWVLVASIAAYAVVYTMFPFENLALRYAVGGGSSMTLWLLIFLQLWSLAVSEMGYSELLFVFFMGVRANSCQAPRSYLYVLPHPTSVRWAQQMASHKRWVRSTVLSDPQLRTGSLHFP